MLENLVIQLVAIAQTVLSFNNNAAYILTHMSVSGHVLC